MASWLPKTINLGKFWRSLTHDIRPEEVLGDILQRELKGESIIPDSIELNRAFTLSIFGFLWAVDIKFRKVSR